jgi:plasmid maintenance system antidote protein VapI
MTFRSIDDLPPYECRLRRNQQAQAQHSAAAGVARDLIPFIGARNRVYEVLNRRRPLTLKMIWRLHEGLGIPAESLIKLGQDRAA